MKQDKTEMDFHNKTNKRNLKMTFKQRQLVAMGIIAVALAVTTITAVKAQPAPKNAQVLFCQQYRLFAEKQRTLGNRWEYFTAKRMFQACLNSARTKGRKDIGAYMTQHEKNDAEQIPAELQGDRYKTKQ